jgi:co-chaperonin GroES (HSP10)
MKPVGYRILVKPNQVDETSEGGIILVQDKKLEKAGQMTGTLVAIGNMAWTQYGDPTPWANVGDRVLYSRYAGSFIEDPISKVEYKLLNDEDLAMVFPPEELSK